MFTFAKRSIPTAIALLGLSLALPAHAEETPAPAVTSDWSFPSSVSLVSDYIFRGQSQTWGKPAVQFGVEADHATGLYAGFFTSNVSDHWLPGASAETDFYGGYRNKIADTVGYDLGVIYYAYPGANWNKSAFSGYNDSNSLNTAEAYVSMSYQWLSFKTGRTLTEYFGWSTNNSPVGGGFAGDSTAGVTGSTRGSYFYELNASYDVAEGWNLNGQIGRQVIANATGLDITYYKAGVTRALPQGWSVSLTYNGSSEPDAYKNFLSISNTTSASNIAKDQTVLSLSKAF
ncbi:MAG: hypothetical protein H6R19_1719 [Proteobacteria bacterium]|jgi:uncharacterized protein (TIGR02001 family)|nr:hypothetical protein [Pseudomonadota bacterium]